MAVAFKSGNHKEVPLANASKVPEVMGFEVKVECSLCGKMVTAKDAILLKFTFCGCDNKARICLQNRKELAHLIGAQDEEKTFVHVQIRSDDISKPIRLPKMTLRQWNTFQHTFKSQGSLTQKNSVSAFVPKVDATFS
jgi:hypothetical protein